MLRPLQGVWSVLRSPRSPGIGSARGALVLRRSRILGIMVPAVLVAASIGCSGVAAAAPPAVVRSPLVPSPASAGYQQVGTLPVEAAAGHKPIARDAVRRLIAPITGAPSTSKPPSASSRGGGQPAKPGAGAPSHVLGATSPATLLASWGIQQNATTAAPEVPVDPETSQMWSDASPDLVISASVAGSPSMADVLPGQVVTLVASWSSPDPQALGRLSQPTWVVSGQGASVAPTPGRQGYVLGTAAPGQATSTTFAFSATQSGEYVVQAQWDGVDSVPLVLTVGLQQLQGQVPVASSAAGVLGVAENLLKADPAAPPLGGANQGEIPDLFVGTPVQGWIPVSGTVPASWLGPNAPEDVEVALTSAAQVKTYVLPLDGAGDFSGVVASPYAGAVEVSLSPAAFGLGAAASSSVAPCVVQIEVPQAADLPEELQASAILDFNDAGLAEAMGTAAALWQNAPDPRSGLEAISNWISSTIIYDYPRLHGTDIAWATATQVYAAQTGICQDYSDLLVSLLRVLGVPSQVVQGYVSGTWVSSWGQSATPNHAWVEAEIGGEQVILDPTWNGSDAAQDNFLTNAYAAQTSWYQATHDLVGVDDGDPVN